MLANTAVSSPSSTIKTRPSTKFSDSLRNRSTWVSPSRTSMAGVQPALPRSPTVRSTWSRAPEASTFSNTIRRSPEMESMMPASSALLPRKLSAKPFIMAGPKLRFTLGVTPMASPIGLRSTCPISLDWANAVELSSRVENNKVRNTLFISVSPFMVVWSSGRLVVWSFRKDKATKRRSGGRAYPERSGRSKYGRTYPAYGSSASPRSGMTRLSRTSRPASTPARFPVRLMVSNANCSSARSRAVGVTMDGDLAGDCSTNVTTTAPTRAAAMPSSHGPRCSASAVRRARALTPSGSSAAPSPASSCFSARSAASSGSRGVMRLFSNAIARSRSRSNESGDLCIGFLLETAPQLAARPERVDLDLVFGKFERGCHRGDVEFLDVAQYQQRARRLRHVGQGRAQLSGPLAAGEFIARPGDVARSQRLVLARHQLQQAASSRAATKNVQAGIAGTGDQPRQFPACVQPFDAAPELDQRFLGHVLGFVVAPQHQTGQLVKPAAVLINELFESTLHTHIYGGPGRRLQPGGNFFASEAGWRSAGGTGVCRTGIVRSLCAGAKPERNQPFRRLPAPGRVLHTRSPVWSATCIGTAPAGERAPASAR